MKSSLKAFRDSGYRLGIASNFDSRLHAVCDGHPDLDPIEYRFVSSETGFRKPAPDFFSKVISHCDCPAREILMIGDDREHDVTAPKALGMQALLLDRQGVEAGADSIQSLHQLISF